MKAYVSSFNREINGRPIQLSDLKYFAKLEYQRHYKGTDKKVQENQPFASKILKLKDEIRNINQGRSTGNIKALECKIESLNQQAPHHQNGKRITQGMKKEGNQQHIHIIISRKDASNTYSLSPGSKYRASEVKMNGKIVKRGFDRDAFFSKAEKAFDQRFGYQRNFVEAYSSRKAFIRNPKKYYSILMKLPKPQKILAFKMLKESGIPTLPNIPTNKAQLALKTFNRLRKGVSIALKSGAIEI
jgi:hypothetical protein|tara:strand:+ start:11818 stop:12549 length:732 start_codon:yes stop_codon:yes gene_type:complete